MGKTYSISAKIKGKDEASGVFRRVGRGLNRSLVGPLRAVRRSLTGIHRGLVALPGLGMLAGGISRAVSGLSDFTTGFSEAADLVAKTSRRAGIAADTLQELAFAGELAGMSTEETAKSLEYFGRSMGQMKAGTGAMSTLLKRVDPDLRKMLASSESADEALDAYLETMAAVTDPSKRAALAVAAFGRSGQKMTLLVENGTEALRAQRREAHELGRVLGKETLGEAEAFNDELTRLKSSWGGLKSVFGAALIKEGLPHLRKLSEWVSENRGQIFEMARGFATDVVGGIRSVVSALPGLVEGIGKVGKALGSIVETISEIPTWAVALLGGGMAAKGILGGGAAAAGKGILGKVAAPGIAAGAIGFGLGSAVGATPSLLRSNFERRQARELSASLADAPRRLDQTLGQQRGWILPVDIRRAAGQVRDQNRAQAERMVISFIGAPAGMRIERTPPGVKTTIATGRRE